MRNWALNEFCLKTKNGTLAARFNLMQIANVTDCRTLYSTCNPEEVSSNTIDMLGKCFMHCIMGWVKGKKKCHSTTDLVTPTRSTVQIT